MVRKAQVVRKTKEVNISLKINLDGRGLSKINTGIDFLNHMLTLFSKHSLFDLTIKGKGDLGVDIHHTNEDTGVTLGEAFDKALGKREKISRFGWAFVCMDDALVRVVVDISGRAYLKIKYPKFRAVKEPTNYSFNYFEQFMKGFSDKARLTLHIEVLEGKDFHHILEASFKALALALKEAVKIDKRKKGLPTTKGKID
jgi:imidazoleglycerol-phosphate dehydratase